ncbi:MAG TPA: PDZ domain-containing protein [Gemmatimonadaceae bacterium]|nr:PDZ domain-containing protein [Gemmatimonadaceae bacterium]
MRLPSLRISAAVIAAVSLAAPAALAQKAAAAASAEAQSAPIANIVYDVTFDSASAMRRSMHVAMSFDVATDAPVVLSIPAWTPGAYEISYFSRGVIGFDARGDRDRALEWDKLDYDSWRVRPAGSKKITVSFDYLADTLDNAMSWSRSDFLLFNGTNVFPYPEGRSFGFPATVRIHTANDWRVATGMTPGTAPRTYRASNYHDLVDMPFFVGRFDLDSARAGKGWLRIAAYPQGSIPESIRATDFQQLSSIIDAQAKVFGEIPFGDYTLMQIADSGYGAISGLEHQNSHVDVTTPLAIGQPILTSIYAHEIFHAWNVKRLRPADLWPYEYADEQPTTWLWMSEGVTDYYADISRVRAGVIDSVAFFEAIAEKMAEVANAPAVALEDASLSTWVHPEDGTSTIYYPKGALAGLMLDVLIRDASDNRGSLDDVMRRLYQESYKQGRGFTGEKWWGAVSAAAGGKSFTDFYARYVDGRDPYPWNAILPLAGLKLATDTTRIPVLGVTTASDSGGLLVRAVAPGSTADDAGMIPGDYLLSVNGMLVTERRFVARLREMLGTRAGARITFDVQRGDQIVELTGALQVSERISMRLVADPAAPAKAVRIRSGLLHGTR